MPTDTVKNKKKVVRAAAIVLIIVILLFAARAVMHLIVDKITEKVDFTQKKDGIFYYEPDYNEDIFKDEQYLIKNRDFYYKEYGNGQMFSDISELDQYCEAAKVLYDYFDTVINGRYSEYTKFFTNDYLKNYAYPTMFTMQRIYDIEVDLFSRTHDTDSGYSRIVEIYIVRYKIMKNNGTFRADIASDETLPVVFEIVNDDTNNTLINAIYPKQVQQD